MVTVLTINVTMIILLELDFNSSSSDESDCIIISPEPAFEHHLSSKKSSLEKSSAKLLFIENIIKEHLSHKCKDMVLNGLSSPGAWKVCKDLKKNNRE